MPTDPHLAVFLREIRDDPDNETPRIFLADWLQDRGDPRGEVIANHLLLHRLEDDDPRIPILERRQSELYSLHWRIWWKPLDRIAGTWREHGGFLDLDSRAPYLLRDDLEEQVRTGAFDWVLSVHLRDVRLREMRLLAQSTLLDVVPYLDLFDNNLTDEVLEPLLESTRLGGLRRLGLRYNRLGPRTAERIAAHPGLARLKRLILAQNSLGDAGALALSQSPYLRHLVELDVYMTDMTQDGLAVLRERFGEAVRFD